MKLSWRAEGRKKFLYKNIYHSGEYKIKNNPYKLSAVFLPKGKHRKKETEESEGKKEEETPESRLRRLNEEIIKIEDETEKKAGELKELEAEYESKVGKAEEDASNLMADAEKKAEEIKEEKSKQGYEEGFDRGYYDGVEKGKKETENKFGELLDTLGSMAEAAKTEKNRIINNTEEDIVNLSINIAEKIVSREIKTDKSIIVNFVKEAIKKLEDKEKIIIYSHPEDIELIKSHREEFRELVDTADTMHILPDELLEPGECRLESKSEIVDTDVDYQFDEIKKKLHSEE